MSSTPSSISYFSESYGEARQKFLTAAVASAFTTISYDNPNTKGPDGEDIFMDIAVAGPDEATRALLITSATHGVEGFCGSACQIGLLNLFKMEACTSDIRIMLVHGLNPYGFAWSRRVNEDNVDLNRNFCDHEKPYPINAGYNRLAYFIAPTDISPTAIEEVDRVFFEYGREYGFGTLQRAISGGQYKHADGLYYGGRAPTWSNRTFQAAAKDHLSRATVLAAIDFHTGLGPFGHGELISVETPNSPNFKTANSWWDGQVKSTKQGTSISADLEGSLGAALKTILPKSKVVSVAAEFGTIDPMEVLAATRDDNWLYLYGNPNDAQSSEIRRRMRRAFYPDSDKWKQEVWLQANDFIRKAIDGLYQEG